FDLAIDQLVSRTRLPRDRFVEVLLDDDWNRRYECGDISTVEYHQHLCDHGDLRMDLEEFLESWSAILLPDLIVPEALLAHLKDRYPLIVVSNTNESHADFVAKNYSVLDYFDATIFSHEVGAMKPDPRIYEAAIAAAGEPAEALLFIDDREENVDGARQC